MSNYFHFKIGPWAPRLTIILIILQMIFIWHIDVSLGAYARGNYLTNGFARYDPLIIYHVCLYCVIIITALLGIIGSRKHFEADRSDTE